MVISQIRTNNGKTNCFLVYLQYAGALPVETTEQQMALPTEQADDNQFSFANATPPIPEKQPARFGQMSPAESELALYDQYNRAFEKRQEEQRIEKQRQQIEIAHRLTMEENADEYFSKIPAGKRARFIERYCEKHPFAEMAVSAEAIEKIVACLLYEHFLLTKKRIEPEQL